MNLKSKILLFLLLVVLFFVGLFMFYPRGLSLIFSYKKECKVARVEQFLKGVMITNPNQMNKFSILCEDGTVCRAEDTGFAAVKSGDEIVFRGYPEFKTFEEFNKCDHAQLIKVLKSQSNGAQ